MLRSHLSDSQQRVDQTVIDRFHKDCDHGTIEFPSILAHNQMAEQNAKVKKTRLYFI